MSNIIRCKNGHYYDSEKYNECPHCRQDRVYQRNHQRRQEGLSDNTLRMDCLDNGVTPVVGWLVCVDGYMKGQDYRLVSGFNRIGNKVSDDILLFDSGLGDERTACSIVHDMKAAVSYLVPEEGMNVLLNGEAVSDVVAIQTDDEIRIGDTAFVFIGYCTSNRRWEQIDG